MIERIEWRAVIADGRRFLAYVWRRFDDDGCLRMAASLSYTSLLAIVPLTAIAFAMLAAFPVFVGVREQLQTVVFANLLPDAARAMSEYFDQFVANTTRLTAVGIIGLALTAVLLLGTIESALNAIFRVAQPRALVPRLLVFWALITLGPLMLGASLSLSTYLFAASRWMGIDPFTGAAGAFTEWLPTLIVMVLLALFYVVIPNRPVNFLGAVVGGVVAGALFAGLRQVFGYYVATFPTYQTIYGAVSVIPIFLVWMYLSWAVVLLGAVLTASLTEWRTAGGRPAGKSLDPGVRLALALHILSILFECSRLGRRRASRASLLSDTDSNQAAIEEMLTRLETSGYAVPTTDNEWVLSRDLASVTLYDLFRDLGLMLSEGDIAVEGEGWRRRLAVRLIELRHMHQNILDVSLREILNEPAVETGKGERGVSGLRPVT
jgi:membrane protein